MFLNLVYTNLNDMKKIICALILSGTLVFISFKTPDVLGKMFPAISGETLAGTTKTIPADAKGKYTLTASLEQVWSQSVKDTKHMWYFAASEWRFKEVEIK